MGICMNEHMQGEGYITRCMLMDGWMDHDIVHHTLSWDAVVHTMLWCSQCRIVSSIVSLIICNNTSSDIGAQPIGLLHAMISLTIIPHL